MQHDLDDIGGDRELAWHRINVAKDDLEAAEMNFKGEHYRSSNNRAYYAIFRAISACGKKFRNSSSMNYLLSWSIRQKS